MHKKVNLQAVSRGNILKLTTKLRDVDSDKVKFRKMNSVVKSVEKIEYDWKCLQDELKGSRLSAKETRSLHVENRKLNILDFLKSEGGPFTDALEIDKYLETEKDQKKAQKRLKSDIFKRHFTIPSTHLSLVQNHDTRQHNEEKTNNDCSRICSQLEVIVTTIK